MSSVAVLSSLGERFRTQREAQGLTLDQLAERSGLSKAYLSRLESGERQPSIATLLTLSRELGVPTSVLLGEGEDGDGRRIALYGDDHPAHAVNGLTIVTCSGFAGSRGLEAVRICIEPDRQPPAFARHRGEEWVYVLDGILHLEYDGASHFLNAGQSAHFDADRPHRLGAHEGVTHALLVGADVSTNIRREHL